MRGHDDYRVRVTQPYMPDRSEYEELLEGIWDRSWLTNEGPCEVDLARALRSYFGAEHLQLASSGTSALQLALAALELTGDIIVTAYSFAATRNAIIRQGCRPIYADIDPVNFALDPAAVERAITPGTQAILVTTSYGLPCDFDALQDIADAHGLKTVYDHAHATGSFYRGRAIVTHGDIGALSFHATKVFHTAEGGGVICSDAAIDRKVRLLKSNGVDGDRLVLPGFNAKMSELHAAMGLAILPQLQNLIDARRKRFEAYAAGLASSDFDMLDPSRWDGLEWNYAYAPIICRDEETTTRTQSALADRGIESRRYFRPAFTKREAGHAPCPVAEDIAERVLCLPLSPMLAMDDVELIASVVAYI
ncbi:DegT/DnrJ/EryC1/StrS family aminotransferase [Erythrobacter sp.]|jgi:dTDP-4-amino-4,6-dideoxygalactose transaminase|uniref:DegT/DnrJ/EryC1/StrS family aminotransferase n=1 Tax=Erythrobacter sp. TaxID=1042 RepID=UPI002EA0B73E|nr:aminotransferase class I/II-fold pyridoxal phosphate-dependent enzyme [Erythrobacter sp.]